MDIDLKTLKDGDTVKFRGSNHTSLVYKVHMPNEDTGYAIEFLKDNWGGNYKTKYYKGGEFAGTEPHPFDIVEIIPKPFGWDDVKPGMAFDLGDDKPSIALYIGISIIRGQVVCQNAQHGGVFICGREDLTRTPEYDK